VVATSNQPARLSDPPAAVRSAPRLFEPAAAGGVSLEDKILGAWEDLVAAASAECPVCGGRMRPADGCDSCGSELN
jgi:hypothetical protein